MKRKLHDQLYLELLEQDDPRAYGKGDQFDKYPYADESCQKLLFKVHEGRADTERSAAWVDSTDFETEGF